MGKENIRTMEDFSRFVGISRPTVSKYFSDPQTVRKSTRERIEEAVMATNFRPNMLAVNFNKQRTNFIGIVIPDAVDPFYASLVQNVIRAAHDRGFIAVMLTSDGDDKQEAEVIATLTSIKVAGLIIIPCGTARAYQDYTEMCGETPMVFVDAKVENVAHFVGTDNTKSMAKIVQYLVRSGSAPCFLPMPDVNRNAKQREVSYMEEMKRLGYEPMVVKTEGLQAWGFEDFAYENGMRILDAGGFPSSTVLCANDRLAYGLMAACQKKGLKVGADEGADIRIAGHDDHPLSKYSNPPLTTVSQDVISIARGSTEMLVALIEGKFDGISQQKYFETQLQMRGSA